jgi:hypothetical protein
MCSDELCPLLVFLGDRISVLQNQEKTEIGGVKKSRKFRPTANYTT